MDPVFLRLPEGFISRVEEFPEKNTLLIAGGRFGEGRSTAEFRSNNSNWIAL